MTAKKNLRAQEIAMEKSSSNYLFGRSSAGGFLPMAKLNFPWQNEHFFERQFRNKRKDVGLWELCKIAAIMGSWRCRRSITFDYVWVKAMIVATARVLFLAGSLSGQKQPWRSIDNETSWRCHYPLVKSLESRTIKSVQIRIAWMQNQKDLLNKLGHKPNLQVFDRAESKLPSINCCKTDRNFFQWSEWSLMIWMRLDFPGLVRWWRARE